MCALAWPCCLEHANDPPLGNSMEDVPTAFATQACVLAAVAEDVTWCAQKSIGMSIVVLAPAYMR